MEYLWMLAGGIMGWIIIEFVATFSKMAIPTTFNVGMLFVGGLTGYTLAV